MLKRVLDFIMSLFGGRPKKALAETTTPKQSDAGYDTPANQEISDENPSPSGKETASGHTPSEVVEDAPSEPLSDATNSSDSESEDVEQKAEEPDPLKVEEERERSAQEEAQKAEQRKKKSDRKRERKKKKSQRRRSRKQARSPEESTEQTNEDAHEQTGESQEDEDATVVEKAPDLSTADALDNAPQEPVSEKDAESLASNKSETPDESPEEAEETLILAPGHEVDTTQSEHDGQNEHVIMTDDPARERAVEEDSSDDEPAADQDSELITEEGSAEETPTDAVSDQEGNHQEELDAVCDADDATGAEYAGEAEPTEYEESLEPDTEQADADTSSQSEAESMDVLGDVSESETADEEESSGDEHLTGASREAMDTPEPDPLPDGELSHEGQAASLDTSANVSNASDLDEGETVEAGVDDVASEPSQAVDTETEDESDASMADIPAEVSDDSGSHFDLSNSEQESEGTGSESNEDAQSSTRDPAPLDEQENEVDQSSGDLDSIEIMSESALTTEPQLNDGIEHSEEMSSDSDEETEEPEDKTVQLTADDILGPMSIDLFDDDDDDSGELIDLTDNIEILVDETEHRVEQLSVPPPPPPFALGEFTDIDKVDAKTEAGDAKAESRSDEEVAPDDSVSDEEDSSQEPVSDEPDSIVDASDTDSEQLSEANTEEAPSDTHTVETPTPTKRKLNLNLGRRSSETGQSPRRKLNLNLKKSSTDDKDPS